jgi:DNA-directed RNA polymerase specialized sigma24 family protein
MSRRPGDAVALATLCEARTRSVSGEGDDLPQETKLKLASARTADKSVTLFKASGS